MTPKIIMSGARETTGHVLCRRCEDLFSRNGESWVLKRMFKHGSFKLLDRLRVAVPINQTQDSVSFSAPAVGFHTDKLAYFAVSMIWRASVFPWTMHDGSSARIELGGIQEDYRRYLCGDNSFPPDTFVVAIVCSDELSQNSAFHPMPLELPAKGFGILVCGLFFAVLIGKENSEYARDMCCHTSQSKPIYLMNRREQGLRIVNRLSSTSHIAAGLSDRLKASRSS
jgi:hypothetical protein